MAVTLRVTVEDVKDFVRSYVHSKWHAAPNLMVKVSLGKSPLLTTVCAKKNWSPRWNETGEKRIDRSFADPLIIILADHYSLKPDAVLSSAEVTPSMLGRETWLDVQECEYFVPLESKGTLVCFVRVIIDVKPVPVRGLSFPEGALDRKIDAVGKTDADPSSLPSAKTLHPDSAGGKLQKRPSTRSNVSRNDAGYDEDSSFDHLLFADHDDLSHSGDGRRDDHLGAPTSTAPSAMLSSEAAKGKAGKGSKAEAFKKTAKHSLTIQIKDATDFRYVGKHSKIHRLPNPWLVFTFQGLTLFESTVKRKTTTPMWDEKAEFKVPGDNEDTPIVVTMKDHYTASTPTILGTCEIWPGHVGGKAWGDVGETTTSLRCALLREDGSVFCRVAMDVTGSANKAADGGTLSIRNYLGVTQSKKGRWTLEELHELHVRQRVLFSCTFVTILAFLLRFVSFDAFLMVLVLLNVATYFVIRNKNKLTRKMTKNSLKRKAGNVKEWLLGFFYDEHED